MVPGSALVFVDTAGLQYDEEATDEGSKFNPMEATTVLEYASRLHEAGVTETSLI